MGVVCLQTSIFYAILQPLAVKSLGMSWGVIQYGRGKTWNCKILRNPDINQCIFASMLARISVITLIQHGGLKNLAKCITDRAWPKTKFQQPLMEIEVTTDRQQRKWAIQNGSRQTGTTSGVLHRGYPRPHATLPALPSKYQYLKFIQSFNDGFLYKIRVNCDCEHEYLSHSLTEYSNCSSTPITYSRPSYHCKGFLKFIHFHLAFHFILFFFFTWPTFFRLANAGASP